MKDIIIQLILLRWLTSSRNAANATGFLTVPAMLPAASINGTLSKLADLLPSTAMLAAGHCLLLSALTVS